MDSPLPTLSLMFTSSRPWCIGKGEEKEKEKEKEEEEEEEEGSIHEADAVDGILCGEARKILTQDKMEKKTS